MTELVPVTKDAIMSTEWNTIRHQAKVLVDSGLMPKSVDTWQKATVIVMYGKELNMGPMEAIQSIEIIQGKPTQKPQSMKAKVHQRYPTAIFDPVELTDKIATFSVARPGGIPINISFTIKEATDMGLTGKDNWKKQPGTMLAWRCIAKICRLMFPECLSGVSYTAEEVDANVPDDSDMVVNIKNGESEKVLTSGNS